MINTIEIKWDLLGAKFAILDFEDQAKFFDGFAKEIMSSSYESHYHREVQMLNVNNKLSEKTKNTLEKYLPALWFKED